MKNFGFNLISAALVLGIFLVLLGTVVNNYEFYFFIIGGVIAFIAYQAMKVEIKEDENLALQDFNKWKDDLKAKGTTINVEFEQCEIKSNKYQETIEEEFHKDYNQQVFDALSGPSIQENQNIEQHRIAYSTKLNEEEVTFYSPLINKEEITLRFLLDNQKSTKIFIDQSNIENFYFDLEFLLKG